MCLLSSCDQTCSVTIFVLEADNRFYPCDANLAVNARTVGKRQYQPQTATISTTDNIGHKQHWPQHAPYRPYNGIHNVNIGHKLKKKH